MKTLKTTVVTLTIQHEKELPDLAQLCAGRAWTLDGVRNVEVAAFDPISVEPQAPKLKPLDWTPIPRWLATQ